MHTFEADTAPKRNRAIKNLLRRLEMDRAVLYSLSSRILQVIVGLITLLMIAHYFTPEIQGFYYTFASLIALQSFVELGLYIVIVNVASHEWVHLDLDEQGCIIGKPASFSRLISLGRFILKWYSVASVIFMVGVSIAGYLFFSSSSQNGVHWQAPWIALVVITGFALLTMPFNSLLEGCGQISTVYKFRLFQSGYGSLALWLTIWTGGALWATVALAGVNVICNLYLQLVRYRHFFKAFFIRPLGEVINWKTEIWPMQWRVGTSGIVNYFAFSLFVPVMFRYHGSIIAGQMGMTWQIMRAIQGLAIAWVVTKVPTYGRLIAKKDYTCLDRYWFRCSFISVIVMVAGALAFWLLIYEMNLMQIPFAQRLLSPLPVGAFLFAFVFMQISQCLTAYLRAHKQEPILAMSVTISIVVGMTVWLLGSRFGPIGAATSYMVAMLIGVVWEIPIWLKCRRIWHEES